MKKILIIVLTLSLLLGNVLTVNAAKTYYLSNEAKEKFPYENESQRELFEKLIIGQWEDEMLLLRYEAPDPDDYNYRRGYIYFKDYKEGFHGSYSIFKYYKEITMEAYNYMGTDYLYIVSLDEKTLVVEYEGKIHTLKRTK